MGKIRTSTTGFGEPLNSSKAYKYTMTAVKEIGRNEHDKIIKKAIRLDSRLFNPLTIDSIIQIENELAELQARTGQEYIVVPVGQPYGGPKQPMAIPREDVDAVHSAYNNGLRGVSPEIGRAYDFAAERKRLEAGKPAFDPSHYPPRFLGFLQKYLHK